MKIAKNILNILAGSLLLSACKKDTIEPFKLNVNTHDQAFLKIIHSSPYRLNPSVQLKLNDTRISSNLTYSTPFPGGGINTGGLNFPYYLAVNPGSTKLSLSIPKPATNIDSLMLYSTTLNLQAGKYYSAFLTDTVYNTQMVLVEDDMTPVRGDVSKFRFVNLIPNLPAIDLYFGSALVAPNIPYKGVSSIFTLPRGTVEKWYIRPAGAASNSKEIAVAPNNLTVPFNKYMTVYARGYNGLTSTTASPDIRIPNISVTYHQ